MALIRAYFDASFTRPSLGARITCIGGYVGSEDEWLGVEKEWNSNLEFWGLDEFHLAPLLAGRLPPVGRADAEACAISFARLIGHSKLTGIVAALRDDDWLQLEKSAEYSARFPTSYHTCLHMLFEVLEEHIRTDRAADDFAVIVDLDKADNMPATEAILDELRANPGCASVLFGRRSKHPLIQCADLCAGLSRKEWLEHGFIPRPGTRRPSKLHFAGHAAHSRGTFWSFETAKYIADMIEAQAKHRAENAARQP